jgi:hypothetical protein
MSNTSCQGMLVTLTGSVIAVFGVIATTLAAEEHYPVALERVAPLGGRSGTEVATVPGGGSAAAWPFSFSARSPPADKAIFNAVTARATTDPRADRTDLLAGAESELVPSIGGRRPPSSVSFAGLDAPTAADCIGPGFPEPPETIMAQNPPDTIVAKSATRVLEGVNTALRLFSTTGTVLDTKTLSSFFGADCVGKGFLFDPKVYFDRNAVNRRFYVVALQMSGDSDATAFSKIWFAVSRSPEPANLDPTNWCRYPLEGTFPRKEPFLDITLTWADYPGLGVGTDAIVISTGQNAFKYDFPDFVAVRALNKRIVANNGSSCPHFDVFTFLPPEGPSQPNIDFISVQPVQHYTSPTGVLTIPPGRFSIPAYLINSHYDPFLGSSKTYKIWRVLFVRGIPLLQGPVSVTGSSAYANPPNAPQPGTTAIIWTVDDRITQAAGVGDEISAVHTTLCNSAGGPDQACIRYVRIRVGDVFDFFPTELTASLIQEETFNDGSGNFDFFPGIAVNGVGQAVIAFHRSSASSFLSSFWRMGNRYFSEVAFGLAQTLTSAGDCSLPPSNLEDPRQPDLTRAGDYIGAQTDPGDFFSFWLAGERATKIGSGCMWQTQILHSNFPQGP